MFRVSQHPSSGVLKTVSATSGIGHDAGTANCYTRWLRLFYTVSFWCSCSCIDLLSVWHQWILNSWFRASWFNVNKKVQLDATVCRHLFTARSLYMFRVSQHPSSGVLKTVSTTSGIGHDAGTATASAELIPICYLLTLLGAHHFLHVSRIRVKSLTLRLLSYIYGAPILDVSRSHTTTHHSR